MIRLIGVSREVMPFPFVAPFELRQGNGAAIDVVEVGGDLHGGRFPIKGQAAPVRDCAEDVLLTINCRPSLARLGRTNYRRFCMQR